MKDYLDASAVLIAISIAVLSGFISEFRAQKSIEALQSIIKTIVKVKRNGNIIEIDASSLVLGDIIFVEEGDLISADARIISSNNLATVEAALTGESEMIEKSSEIIEKNDLALGDRRNMLFTGTICVRGNAFALVCATGQNTELGKISQMLKDQEKSKTPLQIELDKLGKFLIIISMCLVALVIVLGLLLGRALMDIIFISIMLAISSIPEALPAVSTIILALGMQKMSKENALVKNLTAVETLGSVTVICSDKTGTLTENQMTISAFVLANGKNFSVSGLGYKPDGEILENGQKAELRSDLEEFLIAGILGSNANIIQDEDDFKVVGDPTEGSLITLGLKAKLSRKKLEELGYKKLNEIPFNSKDKFMATLYEKPDKSQIIFIKGAADVLMQNEAEFLAKSEDFAAQGLRVIGLSVIENYQGENEIHAIEKELKKGSKFLGLVAMMDPPRADVLASVQSAYKAGVRVIMITGDHPKTASVIAKQIGMKDCDEVISGKELDEMNEEELALKVKSVCVFARVSPQNKLQIVNALNASGQITAMTGDGVNDAPALNAANIGVAMGIRGTEVAKDASDMILLDDRFSTIIYAIREGRIIFNNIEKFVYYLFSCNVVEILAVLMVIILATFFPNLPAMPILPLQILWLNLLIDSSPAMSLAFEKGEENILTKPPRNPKKALMTKKFMLRIFSNGFLISLGTVLAFLFAYFLGFDDKTIITISFTTMAFGQLMNVFNARKRSEKIFDKTILENKVLLFAMLISITLQLLAIYLPTLNYALGTVALSADKWIIIILGASFPTFFTYLYRILK